MAARAWLLLIPLLAGCSWEYHRSHHVTPFYNAQPGEFYATIDSLAVDSTFCERKRFFIKDGDWLHMSVYRCENFWQVDSAFNEKGHHYYVRKAHLAQSESYLYDSSLYIEYDRSMRAIRRTVSIYKADTNYEYWQFYQENGELEKEKRPVIAELLSE